VRLLYRYGCCPETSKDANGSTGTIELRFYLMQLGDALCCIVPKLNEWRNHYFCCAKISSVKEEFFYLFNQRTTGKAEKWFIFGANSKKGVR
jgi:hypothetical protein